MSNMSYCRFQNTSRDLEDCFNSLQEGDKLSRDEEQAAIELINTCIQIAQMFADDDGDEPTKEALRTKLREQCPSEDA